MPTLTKSDQRVARKEAVGHDYPPLSGTLLRCERIWRPAQRLSALTVAPMSRKRVFAAIEDPCRGEDCAKLLTLRIAENRSGILFWPSGAGIRACRQYPRGLSQGGSDDDWAAAVEKVRPRIDATAAIAAAARQFKRGTILHYSKQYLICTYINCNNLP
jgi:hypothetical protein